MAEVSNKFSPLQSTQTDAPNAIWIKHNGSHDASFCPVSQMQEIEPFVEMFKVRVKWGNELPSDSAGDQLDDPPASN